jgi:predicted DNA-binding transcriptional regulator YafY
MEDQPKLERMLRIVLLLSGSQGYTISEISERLAISQRSVSRYISTFRRAGLLVDCSNGVYSIRKFVKPFRELQDLLHFSEEEAYILRRAIQSIDNTNILKANLIHKLYSLYNRDSVADTVVKPGHADIVHNLMEAIRNKKQVLLSQYRSSHGNLVRDRLVEPFDFSTNYISFWAFEPESRTCKLFSTARVTKVIVLDKPDQFEAFHRKDPMDVFRISSATAYPVKLRLTLRACNLLADVRGFEGVGRFVLGLGSDVHVLESEEFKTYLRTQIKKFYHLY